MALSTPTPGLVISYSYLWNDQAKAGREEGLKDRPCVVVLAVQIDGGERVVHVAPITHTPPKITTEAVELPGATKARLGLDEGRSWIVTTELNRFTWPGPDMRPISRAKPDAFAYGSIPLEILKQAIAQIRDRRQVRTVGRDTDSQA